jgi:hypothetical protein
MDDCIEPYYISYRPIDRKATQIKFLRMIGPLIFYFIQFLGYEKEGANLRLTQYFLAYNLAYCSLFRFCIYTFETLWDIRR